MDLYHAMCKCPVEWLLHVTTKRGAAPGTGEVEHPVAWIRLLVIRWARSKRLNNLFRHGDSLARGPLRGNSQVILVIFLENRAQFHIQVHTDLLSSGVKPER